MTNKPMVLPIVDEYKLKCYLCNNPFDTIEKLRKHQEEAHKEFVEHHESRREPAPGDVTVF